MKRDIKIEEILDYVAVEKAPDYLIHKWKAEVELQKERKRFFVLFFRPSIVFPLVLAGFWFYFTMFKRELFEYYLVDKLRSLLQEISPVVADSTSTIASSNYYIIGAGIFSITLAAISLFWFYQGKKLKYARIRNW
jgi:hypothetical protein